MIFLDINGQKWNYKIITTLQIFFIFSLYV